jgi:hypothetical protein
VEGGGGGLTVSGISRNRGDFVKCVAIQERLGIPGLSCTISNIFSSSRTLRHPRLARACGMTEPVSLTLRCTVSNTRQ